MKETSFVYQDKRGFFLHFEQKSAKIRQNTGISGFGAASRLHRSPIFCVQGPDQAEKAGDYLLFITDAKNYEKEPVVGIRTGKSANR